MGFWLGTWAFIVPFIVVIFHFYRTEKAATDCLRETYDARQSKVCSLLSERVDYFYAGKTIIAININAGKVALSLPLDTPILPKLFSHPMISILKGSPKIDIRDYENFAINISDLKKWNSSESVAEEYIGQQVSVTQIGNQINVDSRADRSSINARMVNQRLQFDAANKTGLYIHTTDLAHASLFVRMDMKTANTWVLLLQKLVNGELPAVDSPMQMGT
ncbi:MAG: hypothetical protein KGO49_14060 [Gammaproteobacteria bacterium]|nr:hypothetical protein [Gammaproteobacteria bacterium]